MFVIIIHIHSINTIFGNDFLMKVLIVDDNQDIADMLSKYLTLNNFECSVSYNGRNGLSMIENQQFDVVLLDLAMPEFSGTDIVNTLVRKNKIKDQTIIILTASSKSEKEIDDLITKGVHSCLKKPIDPDYLVDYLKNLFKSR